MQVHCDEGVAIRIDPESCAGVREGAREALTGGRTGQPLSRERHNSGCRRCLGSGRQHGRVRHASAWTASCGTHAFGMTRGRRPWHVRTLLVREPGDFIADRSAELPVRIGKARSRSR